MLSIVPGEQKQQLVMLVEEDVIRNSGLKFLSLASCLKSKCGVPGRAGRQVFNHVSPVRAAHLEAESQRAETAAATH